MDETQASQETVLPGGDAALGARMGLAEAGCPFWKGCCVAGAGISNEAL